jgi:hypothetical protein
MSDNHSAVIQDPLASATNAIDIVSQAARDGAADARAAAIRTWDTTSRIVTKAIYKTSYSVSYGVVFPIVFIAHSIPRENQLVQGLIDGANDAINKVEQIRSR